MIKLIFVLDNNGNLVYGWTPEEVEAYIEKKTAKGHSIFAPTTHSKAPQELLEAELTIHAYSGQPAVVWVLGNAELLKAVLDVADELYITQLDLFDKAEEQFVPFGKDFFMCAKGPIKQSKHGVIYQHQVWKSNRHASSEDLE